MNRPRTLSSRVAGFSACLTACLSLALFAPPAAPATEAAGTVVSIKGTVELGRGRPERWRPVERGSIVQVGDWIRTAADSGARLIMNDDTVINIAENGRILIDRLYKRPGDGTFETLLKVFEGKIRAVVSEYYGRPHAKFQIETPTAVSGVRGTEFIVSYDSKQDRSEIVGISGTVEVHLIDKRDTAGILIGANQSTRVDRGKAPTPAAGVGSEQFRHYLDGLDFIGLGSGADTAQREVLLSGEALPSAERANATLSPAEIKPPPSGDAEGAGRNRTPSEAADVPSPIIDRAGEVRVPF